MHRKILIILFLALLIPGGYFVFFHQKKPLTVYEKAAALLSSNAAEQTTLDTDDDGLQDWEEVLWKTDSKNPDTDNDNYQDGEETRLGYDPNDPSSNPKSGKQKESLTKARNEEMPRINLTQNFAEAMGSKIINPEELASSDPANPFTLLDKNTGQGLLNFISGFNIYIPEKEIKTTSDNSYNAVMNYLNEIKKAIPENPYPNAAEDDILAEAIQTRNFKKVDEYITYYQMAIANLKNITVPSDFLRLHKRELELFMATQKVYESMKEINKDTLKTVLALQENQKIRKEMHDLIIKFVNLAQEHYE